MPLHAMPLHAMPLHAMPLHADVTALAFRVSAPPRSHPVQGVAMLLSVWEWTCMSRGEWIGKRNTLPLHSKRSAEIHTASLQTWHRTTTHPSNQTKVRESVVNKAAEKEKDRSHRQRWREAQQERSKVRLFHLIPPTHSVWPHKCVEIFWYDFILILPTQRAQPRRRRLQVTGSRGGEGYRSQAAVESGAAGEVKGPFISLCVDIFYRNSF